MIYEEINAVIASEAKQSRNRQRLLDCFVASLLAMTAVGPISCIAL
jgi:hypothetical protein